MAKPTQEQLDRTYAQDDALGIPRGLTARQIQQESSWNAGAVSKAGAMGFVQVMPATLESISKKVGRPLNPADFNDAMDIHQYAMSENLKKFGNLPDALRAYNSGWKPERWDNPETNDYVTKVMGESIAAATAVPATPKAPKLAPLAQATKLHTEQGASKAQLDALAASDVGIASPMDSAEITPSEQQSAADMAGKTHWAGAGETAVDTYFWGTLTGRLHEWATRDDPTPGYALSDDDRTRMIRDYPQVYNNNDMRQYVQASVSAADFEKRLASSTEHADLMNRSANTGGLQGFANGAVTLATGIADPVAWAATLGLGAGLNTVRAVAGFGRAGLVTQTVAAGLENAAFDATLRSSQGMDQDAASLIQQGLFGAAIGATAHLAFGRAHVDPSETGTHKAIEAKTQETLNNPVQPKLLGGPDGTLGNSLGDVVVAEKVHAAEWKLVDEIVPYKGQPSPGTDVDFPNRTGQSPDAPRLAEGQRRIEYTPEADLATLHAEEAQLLGRNAEAPRLADSNVIDVVAKDVPDRTTADVLNDIKAGGDDAAKALAERLEAGLSKSGATMVHDPDLPVRGKYDPETNTIHLRDLADHDTALHEMAHAATATKVDYGMKNPESVHGKIVTELDALRKQAGDLYKGTDADAKYSFGNVDEFISGLYSGAGEFIEHLKSLDGGRSIITKLFDAVRRLLGMQVADSSMLARAMGLTDNLIAEHLDEAAHGADVGVKFRPDAESAIHSFKKTAAETAWSQAIKDHVEVRGPASQDAHAWYDSAKWKQVLGNSVGNMFHSVGNTLGRSASKGVRMVASMLAEDPSGLNRQHGTSAALDTERLKHGFRTPFMEAFEHLKGKLLTDKEKVLESLGQNGAALKRIGTQVAEYRLAKRQARLDGVEFDAAAYDPSVQAIGNNLDAFWGHIHEKAKEAGEALGTALGGKGFQGHTPYRWLWADIQRASNESPAKFNALVANFRNQYIAKVVNPAVEGALSKGPLQPGAVEELTAMLHDKVTALTENYITRVMQSPESRNVYDVNHIAKITEDLLKNDFRGQKITNDVVDNVKRKLNEIVDSRERTEFDLLASHEGVRLLDFIDTDIGRMVDSQSQQFAGHISLARRGLGDPMQIEAMYNALKKDKADPKDLDNIDFLIRSLNGNLNPEEAGAAKIFRQFAYASMMGKMGFNALADAAGMTTAVGITGMFRALGRGFLKDTAFVKSLKEFSPGTLAHDHRLFNQTIDHNVAEQTLISEGSTLSNLAQKAADFTSTISGLKAISKMLHNGFTPVFAEDLIGAIKSGKGMSEARLGDLGLSPERIEAIRAQLETHNPGRTKGEAVDWTNWDQSVADDLLGAIQRGTGQALQRIYVGETPRWVTETGFGRMMSQFKTFGWVSAEKQLMRNAFIKDSNSVAAFAVGLPMAALLYRAKLETSMIGMDEGEKNKKLAEAYEKDNGLAALTGTLSMFNMSGMGADFADIYGQVMVGQSHGTSSPAAAMGFISNLKNGVSGIAGAARGVVSDEDSTKVQKELYKAWRMVPGGNSPIATTIINATAPD